MRTALTMLPLLALLGGCMSANTEYTDADGRYAGHCTSSGFGLIGTGVALALYEQCKDKAEARGLIATN